jgi:phytoene dehydrogenase-like protein
MGALPHAHPRPVDVRLGDASRRGIMGAPGRIAALELLAERRQGPRDGDDDAHAAHPDRTDRRMTAIGRDPYDAIVVGGGHNGLTTAAYLAKSGLRTLVLERRDVVGGALAESELLPGVRAPALAHTVGRLRASVTRHLELHRHGLALVQPAVRVVAPQPDGHGHAVGRSRSDRSRPARARDRRDAGAYPVFDAQVRALGGFMARLAAETPPDMRNPSLADAIADCDSGPGFRGLGRDDGRALLRVLPMPVADFVAESFRDDALSAALAARGIQYTAMGPWSAGTTQVLLADSGRDGGAPGQAVFARGGPGRVARSLGLAAKAFGAEIRPAPRSWRSGTRENRSSASHSGRERSSPRASSSRARIPKRLLTSLVDPLELGPSLRWRAGNLRLKGTVAKVNLALAELPGFSGIAPDEAERLLRGRIVIAPASRRWSAPSTRPSTAASRDEPYLEATIPTLVDASLIDDGVNGTRHVMSVIVQYVPYHLSDGSWDAPGRREALGDTVIALLERYAPASGPRHRARGADAARPRARPWPDRRSSAPRRAGTRPVLRVAAVVWATPATGCRSRALPVWGRGTSGRRHHGDAGPQRCSRGDRRRSAPRLTISGAPPSGPPAR